VAEGSYEEEVSIGRWTGLGDVKVVNLGDASGGKHQD